MRASEIETIIRQVPQIHQYFCGFSTRDNIMQLQEEEFTIVNTEYS